MLKGTKEYFEKNVFHQLKEELKFKTTSQVPHLSKIVLSMGLGEAKNNKGIIKEGLEILSLISSQKAVPTIAKKAIAGFKIREEMPIGVKVTLRKEKMYDFFNKLINLALPRQRDFHGISRKKFEGNGNFSLGISDFRIFPEVAHLHSTLNSGIGLVIVTSTSSNLYAEAMMEKMGFPFEDKK